jgi:hypothetical protein
MPVLLAMAVSSNITSLRTRSSQIDVGVEPEKLLETLTGVDACDAWSPVGLPA